MAIDGPFHGDRSVDGDAPLDYQRRIAQVGARSVHQSMRDDSLAALAVADQLDWVDEQRVAFLGMSMGARYGLPVCSALGTRLKCAVLGKFGLTQSDDLPETLAANDMITHAAANIHAPVLQHVQWHDELFPHDGQFELFDLFASTEKVLRARPGDHALTRLDDEIAWREYVGANLESN
ncbi:hypothetical protein [Antrihabitans cavernicola]|uniref:hypothetical protein n=1 Tax=Antrihabitans cavernicola TaxID=2495913 RepID=UPI001F4344DC|nr:hypothetical protein [Spelaeibacter cavernicola]